MDCVTSQINIFKSSFSSSSSLHLTSPRLTSSPSIPGSTSTDRKHLASFSRQTKGVLGTRQYLRSYHPEVLVANRGISAQSFRRNTWILLSPKKLRKQIMVCGGKTLRGTPYCSGTCPLGGTPTSYRGFWISQAAPMLFFVPGSPLQCTFAS